MNIGIPDIPANDQPSTLSDQAFHRVRRMILSGELEPGSWLRKRQLASKLDMSPTPVVEAIRRLQHEGLVELSPQWGARVKIWTVSAIAQLIDMRIALESVSARRSAEILSSEQIALLREIARQADANDNDQYFSAALKADQTEAGSLFRDDLWFHLSLVRTAGLSLLAQEIDRLGVLHATCRYYVSPAIPTAVSHEEILDTIASGDADRAEAAMRKHIQVNADYYLPHLRKRFGDGPVIWDTRPNAVDG